MPDRFDLGGRTALVTGAASGIGRALALALSRRGCHLALADLNEPGLAETARLAGGVRVSAHRLDVADREAVAGLPERVAQAHGGLDLLVNNAGVALGGTFEQVSEADFEWLFAINFHGPVRLVRAFLPMLRTAPEARIVTVSSAYGLIAPPGQTAYAASKFALRGFSQALAHELAGSHVGVTLVHPGGVATSIADSARMPDGGDPDAIARGRRQANSLLRMPPETAAAIILDGVERRRGRVLVGADVKLLSLVERLAPVSYWRLLDRLARVRR